MKRFLLYILVFALGIIAALLYFRQSKNNSGTTQIVILQQGIKNVSKLVVSEGNFSEVYSYSDTDKYFFETIDFEKKLTLLVNAKVQVSYDLKELKIEIDSLHKKVILHHIPEEELNIIPDVKYYDFQQSILNKFTKEELNDIQGQAIEKLLENAELSRIKTQAKERLLEELQQFLNLSKILGWKVEYQTGKKAFLQDLEFKMRD